MNKPAAATWACPVCGRRVPKRETQCFCGAAQHAAEQHHKQEAEKRSTRIPTDVALLVLALVAVGVYAVHRATQDELEPAPGQRLLAGLASTPEPPPTAAPPVPPLPSQPAAAQPTPTPAFEHVPPPPPQTVAPEPPRIASLPTPASVATPAPVDERERVRAAGLAAYEAALRSLATVAGRVEANLRVYLQECGDTQKFAYSVSNCAQIEAAIRRELLQVVQGLEAAEDEARRAWLEPGQVRDARARSALGSARWDEVVSAVQKLKR